jgi:hypothetical protein
VEQKGNMQVENGCKQVESDCMQVENDCMQVENNCMQVENEYVVGPVGPVGVDPTGHELVKERHGCERYEENEKERQMQGYYTK